MTLRQGQAPASADWAAEAAAVRTGAAEARADPDGTLARTRAAQPQWADEDCRHAVHDLARCTADDVTGGLARGGDRPPVEPVDVPLAGRGHRLGRLRPAARTAALSRYCRPTSVAPNDIA